MNILSTPDSKLFGFQKSANNAVSLFTKALSELTLVNSKIQNEAAVAEVKIQELQTFSLELQSQKEANDKIIAKISNIIEG